MHLYAAVLVLAALAGSAHADEPLQRFGPHWIDGDPAKNSYVLHVAAEGGEAKGFITLQCLADEQALSLRVGSPKTQGIARRQTITIWSDKTPAQDIDIAGDPTGSFGTSVMNETAGVDADASFMTLFETVITAEKHISYSIGNEAVTIDATGLQEARALFAELCARPSRQ